MYEIEDNIPLPDPKERSTKYPWQALAIGQSFFVPNVDLGSLRSAASHQHTRNGLKFIVRRAQGGCRVWRIACALLFSLTGLTSAHAEWYVAGDVLWTTYQGPQVDGTWVQEQLPSQRGIPAVRQTKESMAWDVGTGYRFADGEAWYSKLISVEAGYRHMGAGVSAGGLAVSDSAYGAILNGEHPHYKASEYEATTHMEGGYLRVAKGFDVGYGVEPYVSGGAEVLYQDTNFWNRPLRGHGKMGSGGFTGIMAALTAGGGVKYHVGYGVKARVGAESHWVITESGHPISSQWITVGGGIEVPLEVFSSAAGSTRNYLWQR